MTAKTPRNGPSNLPAPTAPLTEPTIQRMLAVQEQKIALELKQTEITLRELDHNQKIADKSIEAQAEDRRDERRTELAMGKQRLIFMGIIVIVVIAFTLAALYMNKDAIVLDVLKVTFGFIGGWGASAAWRSAKPRSNGGQSSD